MTPNKPKNTPAAPALPGAPGNTTITFRGSEMAAHRIAAIRRGLKKLYTAEFKAVTLFRSLAATGGDEWNRLLISAFRIAALHRVEYLVMLFEYGARPSWLRLFTWMGGCVYGAAVRLFGGGAALRAAVRAMEKNRALYYTLLSTVNWDDDSRSLIERHQADVYVVLGWLNAEAEKTV